MGGEVSGVFEAFLPFRKKVYTWLLMIRDRRGYRRVKEKR